MPDGEPVRVVGTNSAKVYYASHQMNVFDKKEKIEVYGRVVDLRGNVITTPAVPMEVLISQPYSDQCYKTTTVPVIKGFYESYVWQMSDGRSFKTKVKLNSGSDYLKIEQYLDYGAYIQSNELF